MTLETILEPLERIEIVVPPRDNSRLVFADVAPLYDNRKVELTGEGHIIVFPPAGFEGAYLSGEAFRQLANWAKRNRQGKAFESNAGFYIPPNENRSPDSAWCAMTGSQKFPGPNERALLHSARTSR
jgi:Uma2 family endonuclease